MKAGVRAQSNLIALQFPIDLLKEIICTHLICDLNPNSIDNTTHSRNSLSF